jgi:hypothetical protein
MSAERRIDARPEGCRARSRRGDAVTVLQKLFGGGDEGLWERNQQERRKQKDRGGR